MRATAFSARSSPPHVELRAQNANPTPQLLKVPPEASAASGTFCYATKSDEERCLANCNAILHTSKRNCLFVYYALNYRYYTLSIKHRKAGPEASEPSAPLIYRYRRHSPDASSCEARDHAPRIAPECALHAFALDLRARPARRLSQRFPTSSPGWECPLRSARRGSCSTRSAWSPSRSDRRAKAP